jgi:siroheme synthase-like protein
VSFGYPAMLEVAGRRCVVIGGTAVCERKVEGLLAAGATDVLAVAEEIDGRFDGSPEVRVERRAWRPTDLEGAFLVIASSGDAATRAAIAGEARARGALVNVMDDVPNCDWAAPAVVRRGDLVVAIGTGGASPAAARLLRERLDQELDPAWVELLRIVAEVRVETRTAIPMFDERARRWRGALDLDEALELVRQRRSGELRARLRERLLAGAS